MKTETILRNARERIAKEENWNKGKYYSASKEADFNPGLTLSEARCFCSLGAVAAAVGVPKANIQTSVSGHILEDWVREAVGKDMAKAVKYLRCALKSMGRGEKVWLFNDSLSTSHADVLAMFDLAIKRARRRHPNGG